MRKPDRRYSNFKNVNDERIRLLVFRFLIFLRGRNFFFQRWWEIESEKPNPILVFDYYYYCYYCFWNIQKCINLWRWWGCMKVRHFWEKWNCILRTVSFGVGRKFESLTIRNPVRGVHHLQCFTLLLLLLLLGLASNWNPNLQRHRHRTTRRSMFCTPPVSEKTRYIITVAEILKVNIRNWKLRAEKFNLWTLPHKLKMKK